MRALLFALVILPATARAQGSTQGSTPPAWAATLDSAVMAELARTGTPGAQVAVVVDGKLAYTKGYGLADVETKRPVREETLFRVGSVSKMFTAAALTELAASGALDLQAPIATYVPTLATRKVGAVTTHQLLTHTAGWIDNAIPYGRLDEAAIGEISRAVGDTLFFVDAGRVLSYSNPGYSVAGYVAEVAGKAPFADVMDRLVLRKIGMPRATFRPLAAFARDVSQGHIGQPSNPAVVVRPVTENTAQWAAGFLFASAAEVARLPMALMNDGVIEGQRVLASESVRRMTTGHAVIPGVGAGHYGYGLAVRTREGRRVWSHGGSINGFDASVAILPDQKAAVVILDNRSGAPFVGITDLALDLAAGIARPTPPPAATPVSLDAAGRAQLVGRFVQGNTRVEIVEDSGKLVLKQGAGVLPVQVMSDDTIVMTLPGAGGTRSILLVRDAGGRVQFLHQGMRALARQP